MGGTVIIVGEHALRPAHYARYAARAAASLLPASLQPHLPGGPVDVHRTLRPLGADLVPPDPVLGDHVYTGAEYRRLFASTGFGMTQFDETGSDYQSFILRKTGAS